MVLIVSRVTVLGLQYSRSTLSLNVLPRASKAFARDHRPRGLALYAFDQIVRRCLGERETQWGAIRLSEGWLR